MELQRIETPEDIRAYRAAFDAYLQDDLFAHSDLGEPMTGEDLRYFRSSEYWDAIERLCARPVDTAHRYFALDGGRRVGFCMCCTYSGEDGKCFVMEMCIFAPYRGKGLGKACFAGLQTLEHASYYELHTNTVRASRFWESLGFRPNGYNEDGDYMMVLPPRELEICCEPLQKAEIPQIAALQNNYKRAIGEPLLNEAQQTALREAIEAGVIRFFVARYRTRVVGMCSVSRIFSTYQCQAAGVFEDFYIEPVFRRQGIARRLTKYVQITCAREGIDALWAGCAPCDEAMYRTLGFAATLGTLLAWNREM